MRKQLIPIVAAYWGQNCIYNPHTIDDGKIDLTHWEVQNINNLIKFKLHLRKPDQITNEELRTLSGLICGIEYEPESFEDGSKCVRDYDDYDVVIVQPNGVIELGSQYGGQFAKATNYLRSIGICVDQCLIDEGLVEWVGND